MFSPLQAFSIQFQDLRISRAVEERSIDKVGGLQQVFVSETVSDIVCGSDIAFWNAYSESFI